MSEDFGVQDPAGLAELSKDSLPSCIHETPLAIVDGVYAKLECVNPCGSIKDRIVQFILLESRKAGFLLPGQAIVEATSGNTGISLAYYGRLMGHPVTIVMPEHMTEERKDLIRALGAHLILCSKEGAFIEAATIRDQISKDKGAFNLNQFANRLNVECHRATTGQEIIRQLPSEAREPIAFVAGVGTGGTLIGVGEALKDAFENVSVFAVEPEEAAVMTHGHLGRHGISGIGDGFVPAIAADGQGGIHEMIEGVEVVSTDEALAAAHDLADTHSLCVGVSSGANFVAAKRLQDRYSTVITVFADGYHKYESVGLMAVPDGECPYSSVCADSVIVRLLHHT